LEMMKDPPDIMVVIGGYNSSNTNHLAHICRQFTTTYHIADAGCIDVDSRAIRHKAELDAASPDVRVPDWLPDGPVSIGLTAGAVAAGRAADASGRTCTAGAAMGRILAAAGTAPGA